MSAADGGGGGEGRRSPLLPIPAISFGSAKKKRGGRLLCRPLVSRELAYFKLVIAVRSTESLAMPVAPHQLDPTPVGLIDVTLVVPEAV